MRSEAQPRRVGEAPEGLWRQDWPPNCGGHRPPRPPELRFGIPMTRTGTEIHGLQGINPTGQGGDRMWGDCQPSARGRTAPCSPAERGPRGAGRRNPRTPGREDAVPASPRRAGGRGHGAAAGLLCPGLRKPLSVAGSGFWEGGERLRGRGAGSLRVPRPPAPGRANSGDPEPPWKGPQAAGAAPHPHPRHT